jgi:RNA polymerase sigma-70 factor (ECF subfamily)
MGWRLFGRMEEAKDFAQDVFIRVYERRKQYDPSRPFQPWFYKVAMNLGREHMRRYREYPAGEDLPEGSVAPEVETKIAREEEQQHVRRTLGTLSPKVREILALRFESEMSLQEMADVLSVPLGTVKSRLSRGLEAFHEAFRKVERSEVHV